MGDDDIFIGIGNLRFVPSGYQKVILQPRGFLIDSLCCGHCKHHAFEQGVTGHTVSAMKARETRFSNSIEVGDISLPRDTCHNAAAGIVGSRHDGYGFLIDVDAEIEAASVDGRKVFLNEQFTFMANIQLYAVATKAFHFMIDGTRNNISGRQFLAAIKLMHEFRAVRQNEFCAFTP